MDYSYKVTVIVPVYGVEKFIERCAITLMEQTLSDVEYVFVNDSTKDQSIDILEGVVSRYPSRAKDVRIIHHEYNKGLPAARNTGLDMASGEYIYHCDSDDFVEPQMLAELYNYAKLNDSDIVWSDWFLTYDNAERYMTQPAYKTPMEALKSMLAGGMKFNVWNKLARHSLYVDNDIRFPEGYGMGEDMTMMMLFAHSCNVAYLPKAYYHYVKTNTNAFSQNYSDKHLLELNYNVYRIVNYIYSIYGDALLDELNFLKLEAKFPFLITNNFKRWSEWYPESNQYILRNRYVSKRSRWIQWMASKRQFWLVWIYNQILNRIVYGLLYRSY